MTPDTPQRKEKREFTDRSVKHASPGIHIDAKEKGLMLQVLDTGGRSFILRTVVRGKRRSIGLGGYPDVSLEEAREKARHFRKIARQGGDPLAEKQKEKKLAEVPTFAEAAEQVHAEHSKSWANPKHRKQWINTLREYAVPTLGKLRVDAIRSGDIMRAIGPIWLDKPETARRVLQRVGTVLLWAKGHGYRTDAPTDEIAAARKALPKQTDRPEHHSALPYAEVPAFISKLRAFDGASDGIKLALEFAILTATRTNEVLMATWAEVNLKDALWTIPASRMKARREHRVPLSPRCVEILEEARTLGNGKGYIFPGEAEGKPYSNMVFLMAMRRMGFGDYTSHGFRSSFRDWTSEQTNAPRDVCEAALAHVVKDATEAAYRRSDLFAKRRELMEAWARYATDARGAVVDISTRKRHA